jgi:FMN phosphatase YigB (HAD superfamily)
MITRPKVLLLDVDGVVFNHRGIIRKVGTRVVEYVARELKVDLYEAEGINHLLYTNFGHTHIGLNAVYRSNKTPQQFADFVYSKDMLESVRAIELDGDLLKNSADMSYIAKHCATNDIGLYLFSNAPASWCAAVVAAMNLDNLIDNENIFSSDHDLFTGALKPNRVVYENIAKYIAHKYRDSSVQLNFVDDSFMNLIPILGDHRWRPIHFNRDGTSINNRQLTTIESLYQLQRLI